MTRAALGLVLVTLVAVAALTGQRESSLNQLTSALSNGRVAAVTVIGALPPSATGYTQVTISWQEGWQRRVTTVIERKPLQRGAPDTESGDIPVVGDVDSLLTQAFPDVRIDHRDSAPDYATLWAWRVPVWAGLTGLLGALLTLGLLIGGPEPWRATRWAWFWLMICFPVAGALAFLVLSGPAWGLPDRSPGERRLTGGWSLLAGLVFGVAVTSVLGLR